ncbi:MAG: hypothetical protein ACTSW4_06735 [Candidatus Ranarchaeia archaeon]
MTRSVSKQTLCIILVFTVSNILGVTVNMAETHNTTNVLIVPYAISAVNIDGRLQGVRSDGGNEWWDSTAFATLDRVLHGFLKHNGTHLLIGLSIIDRYKGLYDWIHMLFEEGDKGTRGAGSSNGRFDAYSEDYKFLLYDKESEHLFKGDGYYYGGNIWYAAGGPSFPIEYAAEMRYLNSRWEIEFAIPLTGREGIEYDYSDLTAEIGDIIGWYVAFNSNDPKNFPQKSWHCYPNVKWPPSDPSQMVLLYLSPYNSHLISGLIFLEILSVFSCIGFAISQENSYMHKPCKTKAKRGNVIR